MRALTLGLYGLLLALLVWGQWTSPSEASLAVRLVIVALPAVIGVALLLPARPRLTASSLPMLLYFCVGSIEWYSATGRLTPALVTLTSAAYLLLLGGWGWRGLKARRAAQTRAEREGSA